MNKAELVEAVVRLAILEPDVDKASKKLSRMFEVVPWCAEHDHQMDTYSGKHTWCCDAGMDDRCRLEEPARHVVLEVEDE